MRKPQLVILTLILVTIVGCGTNSESQDQGANGDREIPTLAPIFSDSDEGADSNINEDAEADSSSSLEKFTIVVNAEEDVHPISPLIYGVSGADLDYIEKLKPTFNSWGGNPSTRYNWEIGSAWNAGSDWYYRNGNYDYRGESASDDFIEGAMTANISARLAVPTLGWVARNDDNDTCSFPLADGSCGDANGADCTTPGEIADPTVANVPSDPQSIANWMMHLFEENDYEVRFVAMDNEPELWGHTHYDVHPDCTTYEEVLGKYIAYAPVVHEIAPAVEITAPAICCWFDYWDFAPGPEDTSVSSEEDFLSWFLDNVQAFDEEYGERTLDVMDVHYYPEGVFNDDVDEATMAQRLRSTRSLWDEAYIDESWIGQSIHFIPRMKQTIAEHYPDTKLGISEWNWGADWSMNGALAIADVLGIYGREDVYFASYWRYPEIGTPGYYAFKMYTNFDDANGRFADTSIQADSPDVDIVASYAGIDSETGDLHLMLINKQPDSEAEIVVQLEKFVQLGSATMYRYDETIDNEIVVEEIIVGDLDSFELTLPAYSITLLILPSL